ncbi:MAG: protein-export chaperone SecB [Clostridia bacterium]|nr:protein-export chaperone SecB [Clostridia bacterium]
MEPLANVQIVTNEVVIKNNDLQPGEFTVSPVFARKTGMISETVAFVELTAIIENTVENPFPIDIKVRLTGIFDLVNFPKEQYKQFMDVTAVQILFPYVRSIITNATSSALMPPIILPIIDVKKLFPDESSQDQGL